VGESLTDAASTIADRARAAAGEVGSELGDAATGFAEDQKASGAKLIQNVSEAARAAADKLAADSPTVAGYVRDASQQIDRFASDFQNRSIGDLMRDVGDFARRQPALFIAGSVLAGFMLTRFLKSSAPDEGTGGFAGSSGSLRRNQGTRDTRRQSTRGDYVG